MPNKVTVLIDVAVDKAVGSLKSFRTSVQEAEGVGGKFKAGWKSATDSVKANAAQLGIAAGAAIAGFALKALGDFQRTAIAAEDAGKRIGISTEDASRWIEFAGDFGIEADAVVGALGRVGTSIDDDKWLKYGIQTHDAAGEARDANDIILDTFGVLAEETNLTERARLAKELFGKSYGALAPIIGKSREEIEAFLKSVDGGKTITQEEADRARKMALAQDALRDAFEQVTLAVGGVVAKFSPLIENFAAGITKAEELAGKLGVVSEVLDAEASFLMGDFSGAVDGATGKHVDFKLSADELEKSLIAQGFTQEQIVDLLKRQKEATEAAKDKTDDLAGSADDLTGEQKDANKAVDIGVGHLEDLERASDNAEEKVTDLKNAVSELRGELDQEQAALDYKQAIDEFGQAMVDAKGDTDAQAQAIIDIKGDMLDYLEQLKGVPVSKQTQIVALIEEGSLQEAARLIDELTKERTISVKTQITGASGGKAPAKLPGKNSTSESVALVGDFGGSGSGGSPNVSITINGGNKDARQLYDELATEARRRGVTYFG